MSHLYAHNIKHLGGDSPLPLVSWLHLCSMVLCDVVLAANMKGLRANSLLPLTLSLFTHTVSSI